MTAFFDGHHYVEDVAAARIKNYLSYGVVELTEKQTEEIARTIMGVILSYIITEEGHHEFIELRVKKWGLTSMNSIAKRSP
jgi:hypothetical protein